MYPNYSSYARYLTPDFKAILHVWTDALFMYIPMLCASRHASLVIIYTIECIDNSYEFTKQFRQHLLRARYGA